MTKLNLKGYIVGNGATNWDIDISPAYPDVVYNFNIIPKTLLQNYTDNNCISYFRDVKPATNTTVCKELWNQIKTLDSGLNWYDLFRKTYPNGNLLMSEKERLKSVEVNGETKTYKSGFTWAEYTPWAKHIPRDSKHPILGAYMSDYVNRPDVRAALNIPDSLAGWNNCDDYVSANYHLQYEGSMWIYKIMKQYGYRILFFSGDTDGAVPTLGTRRWLDVLNWDIKEDWRSWVTDG
jgi:hypothetical protein